MCPSRCLLHLPNCWLGIFPPGPPSLALPSAGFKPSSRSQPSQEDKTGPGEVEEWLSFNCIVVIAFKQQLFVCGIINITQHSLF